MFGGELALAIVLLLGGLPGSDHIVVTESSHTEFEVRVNGVALSASPVLADSLGLLVFELPALGEPGPATVSLTSALAGPSIFCGESPR
jgi:hypothetical protein